VPPGARRRSSALPAALPRTQTSDRPSMRTPGCCGRARPKVGCEARPPSSLTSLKLIQKSSSAIFALGIRCSRTKCESRAFGPINFGAAGALGVGIERVAGKRQAAADAEPPKIGAAIRCG